MRKNGSLTVRDGVFLVVVIVALIVNAVLLTSIRDEVRKTRATGVVNEVAAPSATTPTSAATAQSAIASTAPAAAQSQSAAAPAAVTGVAGGSTGVSKGEVKIGAVITQSGLADETPILHGLSAWVQHVNAAGGVNGRKIKLITADDGSDTSRGSAELRKLVEQDKVFALVAECGPLTDAQNFEYLKQKGVPVVGTCILPTKDFNTNPFQYPLRITPDSFGRIMAKYAVSDMGSKKPAVVYINQAPIDEMGNGAVQQWKAMGVNNYVVEQVSVVEPNYTPTVVDLRRQGVDNVTLLLDNASTIRFLQAASQQGWKPPMISLTAFDEQVIRYGGAEIEGTVAPFFMEPVRAGSNAATTQFRADMQRYYPSEPEIELALNGWFPGHVFTDMLARLGDNISRRALMQQLDSLTNYDTGIIPPFTERVGHHETRRAAKWGVIEGGKAVFHNKDWWFLYPDHS